MQRMGLSTYELRAYHAALLMSHTVRIRVAVLDLNGNTITSITPVYLSGQIIVDADQPVSRTLQLELLDPHHALHFDSADPDDGALYADRMLRVFYTVNVPALNRHVTAVPFTGPIVKFERRGDIVSVEAQGKEAFALRPAWVPLTIKKFTEKVDAIEKLLRHSGETRFSLPAKTKTLPKVVTLARYDQPWLRARKIAKSMNRQLFYPGTGTATVRAWPTTPVFTFATGEGGSIVEDISVSNQMDDFANVVEVIGGKPRGAKKRVRFVATAPSTHPLSPTNLGRGGQRSFTPLRIDNDDLRSIAECKSLATRTLHDRLRQRVEVASGILPMPHFDEGDLVRYVFPGGSVTTRLNRWTLPLHVDGNPSMPVGYVSNTMVRKARMRRR